MSLMPVTLTGKKVNVFPSQVKPLKKEKENERFLLFVFPPATVLLCFIAYTVIQYDKKASRKKKISRDENSAFRLGEGVGTPLREVGSVSLLRGVVP